MFRHRLSASIHPACRDGLMLASRFASSFSPELRSRDEPIKQRLRRRARNATIGIELGSLQVDALNLAREPFGRDAEPQHFINRRVAPLGRAIERRLDARSDCALSTISAKHVALDRQRFALTRNGGTFTLSRIVRASSGWQQSTARSSRLTGQGCPRHDALGQILPRCWPSRVVANDVASAVFLSMVALGECLGAQLKHAARC
jgi:hypothetical protein